MNWCVCSCQLPNRKSVFTLALTLCTIIFAVNPFNLGDEAYMLMRMERCWIIPPGAEACNHTWIMGGEENSRRAHSAPPDASTVFLCTPCSVSRVWTLIQSECRGLHLFMRHASSASASRRKARLRRESRKDKKLIKNQKISILIQIKN